MKKFISIIALATVFAACSKENAPQIDPKEDVTPSSSKEVILFAEIPAMIDDTKAIADGSFSWAENDEIAIPISGGYAIFAFDPTQRNGQGAFTYTLTGSETFINGKAYYPASSRPSGDYSINFANPDAARAGFMMEADYHVGDDHIDFTHKSSLIDLNFSNVPSFATSVQVKEGETVVATVALSSPSSSVEVKVPVTPNNSKTYTFSLMENSNIIKQVSKSGVTLTAGRYYKTPAISIGHVIRVQDSVSDWDSKALYVRNVNNSGESELFTTSKAYPYTFNTISDNDHYIIAPSEKSWMVDGCPLLVSFRTDSDSKSTYTDCVYLYGDITFTVPAELGMKRDYRVYFDNSTKNYSNVKVFAWGDIGIYVYCTDTTPNVHYWRTSDSYAVGWPGKNSERYTINGTQFFFYELGSDFQTTLGIEFGFNDWHSDYVSGYDFNGANHFFWYYNTEKTRGEQAPNYDFSEVTKLTTNKDWPGDDATLLSGDIYYFSIPSSKYGKAYNFLFSDNGSNKSKEWHLAINRDYMLNN